MVAKVQITTTVSPDGSVRLLEHEIEPAGIRPGDRVRIQIVKEVEKETSSPPPGSPAELLEDDLSAEDLARLSFDEWLEYGRANLSFEGRDVEEIRRLGEEYAAGEFWERFNQRD